jgi:hypothetical protein
MRWSSSLLGVLLPLPRPVSPPIILCLSRGWPLATSDLLPL